MGYDADTAVFSNVHSAFDLIIDGARKIPTRHQESQNNAIFIASIHQVLDSQSTIDVSGWISDTICFIEFFKSYPGQKVMIFDRTISLAATEVLSLLNNRFELAQKIQEISITETGHESNSLIFEGLLRANLDSMMLLEELHALCMPVHRQDLIDIASIKSFVQAAVSDTESMRNKLVELGGLLKKAELENKLGRLQNKNILDELESYHQSLKAAEEYKDEIELCEKVKVAELLPKNEIVPYMKDLFDSDYYPLFYGGRYIAYRHYKIFGWKTGRDPHPLFDTTYYLQQVGLLLTQLECSPLQHYFQVGNRFSISCHPEFDVALYEKNNPDVYESGIPAIIHFCNYGWKESRNPNDSFDCNRYLNKYVDVKSSGVNPFVHYLQHGKGEGRNLD